MSYIGNEPVISATRTITEVVASGGQTVFYPNGGYTVGYLDVAVNGATLQASDFVATNGTSVTLNAACTANDDVKLVAWGTVSVANTYTTTQVDTLLTGKLSTGSGAVGTTNIADSAVTTAKVADGAITSSKIADATIVEGDLADGAVATAKLAANAVTLAKLARVGTAGQVLTSNGAGADPSYQSPASGGVTSIATTGGIVGGTITSTGTLSLNTNNNFGIGSTQVFWMSQNVSYTAGSTISGSYLFYVSAVGGSYDGWVYGSTMRNEFLPVNRTTTYVYSPGSGISATYTPVGGTWRLLGFVPRAYNQGCCGPRCFPVLCIRTA